MSHVGIYASTNDCRRSELDIADGVSHTIERRGRITIEEIHPETDLRVCCFLIRSIYHTHIIGASKFSLFKRTSADCLWGNETSPSL